MRAIADLMVDAKAGAPGASTLIFENHQTRTLMETNPSSCTLCSAKEPENAVMVLAFYCAESRRRNMHNSMVDHHTLKAPT
jgi:hypothetical protein